MNELDTSYTDNPVCPYCGAVDMDAWEINLGPGLEGDGESSCGSCEKTFFISRMVSISYTTKKLDEQR